MTVIARFEVIPVRDGSMSTAIASALRALDRHPVSYETTATDTIIEADTVDQVFAAVQAAHEAIPEDRVITSVEIDEDRRRPQSMRERVASVERELGHPPHRRQPRAAGQRQPQTAGQRTPVHEAGQQQMPSSGRPSGPAQTPPVVQSHGPTESARGQSPDGPIRHQPPGPTL